MRPLICSLMMTILGTAAFSQPVTPDAIPKECRDVLADIRTQPADRLESNIADALKLKRSSTCFAWLLIGRPSVAPRGFADFIQRLESLRTDKQAGASVGSGGTTNLVAKGTTAKVLSVAAEYGALQESVNKQIVTVRGSLDGLPAALVGKQVLSYCLPTSTDQKGCIGQEWFNILRRFGYSVSFDTTQNDPAVSGNASGQPQGTAQPVTFTATHKNISAWEARVVLWNSRDSVSAEFQKKWNQLLMSAGKTQSGNSAGNAPAGGAASSTETAPDPKPALDAANALITPLEDLIRATRVDQEKYSRWYASAFMALRAADRQTPGALESIWVRYINEYLDLVTEANPKASDAAVAFIRAMSNYDFAQQQFVEAIANKPVLTLQYNNNRPIGQSSTSTTRLIFDRGFGATVSLALNGAFTLYNSDLPRDVPGVSRIRDAQFAAQIQKNLGKLAVLGAAAIAGSYYFQYQNSPAVLNVTPNTPLPGISFTGLPSTATQVFAEKGNLHIGQLRLVLAPGSSSVRFPLAISYSNRTELIAKPAWKAQIGISYDFDSLFAR